MAEAAHSSQAHRGLQENTFNYVGHCHSLAALQDKVLKVYSFKDACTEWEHYIGFIDTDQEPW